MSRKGSLPILFDQCTVLNTKDLVEWGYLKPSRVTHGQIKWIHYNYDTIAVSIIVDTIQNSVQLNYNYNGTNFNYEILLNGVLSNLGKGIVYFLVCPKTGTRCRKLHLYRGIFRHRSSFHGFYQWQVYGKKDRALCQIFDSCQAGEKALLSVDSKYFKKHYAGRVTKRYAKLVIQLKEYRKYPRDIATQLMIR